MRPASMFGLSTIFFSFISLFPAVCSAQKEGPRHTPSRIGVAVKMSLLGAGIDVATPLSRRSNVRAGFNMFRYSRGLIKDGVTYTGKLDFRSVEAHYDWFPFGGGFHLSPGLLVYNWNQVKANASVPAGRTFTLSSTTYSSDPADPIGGTGNIAFKKVAPTFLLGWGNLLPRSGRHFSIPFEFGAAYQGAPRATLAFHGGACDAAGANCQNIGSDSAFQSNLQSEQAKLNRNMSAFKFYPLLSVGVAFNSF